MALRDTLLLDTLSWDLVLDSNGNIAMASAPYAPAQDAASAIRLFKGELWYNTVLGVPYWSGILGESPPPISLMKSSFVAAAERVPGVVSAICYLTGAVPMATAVAIPEAIGSFIIGVSTIGGGLSEPPRTASRRISGQVQITDENNRRAVAAF